MCCNITIVLHDFTGKDGTLAYMTRTREGQNTGKQTKKGRERKGQRRRWMMRQRWTRDREEGETEICYEDYGASPGKILNRSAEEKEVDRRRQRGNKWTGGSQRRMI